MVIEKVGIIGAGLMGMGIAQALAQKGFGSVVCDLDMPILDGGLARIKKNLERLVKREKMTTEAAAKVVSLIMTTTEMAKFASVDLVIEAVVEDIEVKKEIFARLDRLCPEATILATNTSTLSTTEIASATQRPSQVIGMHWFNPAPVMRLIEVTTGRETSEATVLVVMEFARRVGKHPVRVKEAPGGIVSRILRGYLNVAVDILAEGVATVEDIDAAMKLGANFPMGPLELLDLIGLDIHTSNSDILAKDLGDLKYSPNDLLREMVRAGHLGRKTGRGFYDYTRK